MRHDLKLRLFLALPAIVGRRIMFSRLRREIATGGEPELLQLRKLLKIGDLVVDVGANLGVYSYEAARVAGRVVAFEPNPLLFRLLRKLSIPGVEVREIAASSRDGEAELNVPFKRAGHALGSLLRTDVSTRVKRTTVRTSRLDAQELPKVALIKIYVEGFEEEVIAGASGLIARDQPMLLVEIVEHFNRGGIDRIAKTMASFGYKGFFFVGDERRSISDFSLARDQKYSAAVVSDRRTTHYVNNFLFLPSEAGVSTSSLNKSVVAA